MSVRHWVNSGWPSLRDRDKVLEALEVTHGIAMGKGGFIGRAARAQAHNKCRCQGGTPLSSPGWG